MVLGERGSASEAVEVISEALALEPQNADLIAQARELQVIEKERAAERSVAAAVSGKASAETTIAGGKEENIVNAESIASMNNKTNDNIGDCSSGSSSSSCHGTAELVCVSAVDGLLRCLQHIMQATATTAATSTTTSSSSSSSSTDAESHQKEEYAAVRVAITASATAVAERSDLKIYARTCGALETLI